MDVTLCKLTGHGGAAKRRTLVTLQTAWCWRTSLNQDSKLKSRMRTMRVRIFVLAVFAAIQLARNASPVLATAAMPAYDLASSLKVGGEGGWDYVTLNREGRLLYVTRSTHTM